MKLEAVEHPRITKVGRLLARIADLEAQLKDAYELAYDVARHDMEVQFAKAEAENERLRRERDEQVAAALQERDDIALAMEGMRRLRQALREAQEDMNEVGVVTPLYPPSGN